MTPRKFRVGDRVVGKNCVGVPIDASIDYIDDVDDDNYPYQLSDGAWAAEKDLSLAPITSIADIVHKHKTAIVARHTNSGQPLPAARPFVHDDREAATREAERLARTNPGVEFGVYEFAGALKEEKVYEHEWQQLAASGSKFSAITNLRRLSGLESQAAQRAVDDWLQREAA